VLCFFLVMCLFFFRVCANYFPLSYFFLGMSYLFVGCYVFLKYTVYTLKRYTCKGKQTILKVNKLYFLFIVVSKDKKAFLVFRKYRQMLRSWARTCHMRTARRCGLDHTQRWNDSSPPSNHHRCRLSRWEEVQQNGCFV